MTGPAVPPGGPCACGHDGLGPKCHATPQGEPVAVPPGGEELRDRYGHTEADHEAAGACVRPGLTGRDRKLREAIARAISSAEHGSYWWPYNATDAVLALPAVRDALAAQEAGPQPGAPSGTLTG